MLRIVGEDTLLRQTIKRINGFVPPKNIWIVTTEDKAQDIKFHLDPLGSMAREIQFIKEPLGRNTAPAIGLTAIYLQHFFPQSVMIVMPSDHAIPDTEHFLSDLRIAIQGAMKDHLVTFGIKPNRPETGYGYIKVKEKKAKAEGRRITSLLRGLLRNPILRPQKNMLLMAATSGTLVSLSGKLLKSSPKSKPTSPLFIRL